MVFRMSQTEWENLLGNVDAATQTVSTGGEVDSNTYDFPRGESIDRLAVFP